MTKETTSKKLEQIQEMLDSLKPIVADLQERTSQVESDESEPVMSYELLATKLANTIESKMQRVVPAERELWDASHIAQYLHRHVGVVRERITVMPSFPKAIRIQTTTGRANPLYKAVEVMTWAEKQKEKH